MMTNKFCIIVLIFFTLFVPSGLSLPSNTLNIGFDPKDQVPIHYHTNNGGISSTTYFGSRRENIRRVMDSGSLIWEARTQRSRLSMLKIHRQHKLNKLALLDVVNELRFFRIYYEKIGYRWVEISYDYYQFKFQKLLKERIIDISEDIDKRISLVHQHNFYGLPATVIIPNEKFEVVSVNNNFEILWSRQIELSKCTAIILHGHKNDVKMVHLHIKQSYSHHELFFVNHSGTFEPVNKDIFYAVLNSLDKKEEEKKRASMRESAT